MPLKVLIAPDKFKGTLTAREAAQAIATGWRQTRHDDSITLLPVTDGGDGFGQLMGELIDARRMKCKTVNAAHLSCTATWWWNAKTKTAVIESANVIGLAMLPPGKFHPFDLDTFGLGKVIQTAQAKGAKKIYIGIGGSATNDAGFGLARAMGWKFLDVRRKEIKRWTQFEGLCEIRRPKRKYRSKIIVAVDVQNRLLGPRGATRVYGPQKGLRPEDFELAERCLKKLVHVRGAEKQALIPGTGAAGGLGFGLHVFIGAELESGFQLFARLAELERHLRSPDIVITGEGAIDRSTFMGKGVGEIARRCRKLKIPCLAIGGTVEENIAAKLFSDFGAMVELTSVKKAKAKPAVWVSRLAEKLARNVSGKLHALGLH